MMSNPKSEIKKEVTTLVGEGNFLFTYIAFQEGKLDDKTIEALAKNTAYNDMGLNNLSVRYQKWFTKSSQVVKQILPDRHEEFRKLYSLDKRDKKITNSTYTISDYLMAIQVQVEWNEQRVDEGSSCINKLQLQIGILESCSDILESKLYDIENVLQFEIFEDELNTAKTVLKKGSLRISGALAGITLERHLKKICQHHSLKLTKQNPTISDYNEELKKHNIIDVPTWRLIQRLGDIRNLSVHAKDREPTSDEVQDLIIGCEKFLSELF